jgi:hypothetical protein
VESTFLRTKAWWTCFDIGMVVRYESFVGYINSRGDMGGIGIIMWYYLCTLSLEIEPSSFVYHALI